MAKLGVYGGKQYVNDGILKSIQDKNLQDLIIPKFFRAPLNEDTANLAENCQAIAIFVNDDASESVIRKLHSKGVRIILCMCSGFNMVNLDIAEELGIIVTTVPSYSPCAIAEYAIGMIQTLNRKYHRAYNRTRECNFEIEGLMGINIRGKVVGVLGTGAIGTVFCKIMRGFECKIIAFDVNPNEELSEFVEYKSLDEVLAASDFLTIFLPLLPSTYHLLNEEKIWKIKKGAYLVNVSRGGIIDTKVLTKAIHKDHFSGVALDVVEHEDTIFYQDKSINGVKDDNISILLGNPKVVLTSHMAFFTQEAVNVIMNTTIESFMQFLNNQKVENQIRIEEVKNK